MRAPAQPPLEEMGAKSSATLSSKMPPVARKTAAMTEETYGHASFFCSTFCMGDEVVRGRGEDLASSCCMRRPAARTVAHAGRTDTSSAEEEEARRRRRRRDSMAGVERRAG